MRRLPEVKRNAANLEDAEVKQRIKVVCFSVELSSLPYSGGNHLQKYLHSQETPHSTVLLAYSSSSFLPDSLNFQRIIQRICD